MRDRVPVAMAGLDLVLLELVGEPDHLQEARDVGGLDPEVLGDLSAQRALAPAVPSWLKMGEAVIALCDLACPDVLGPLLLRRLLEVKGDDDMLGLGLRCTLLEHPDGHPLGMLLRIGPVLGGIGVEDVAAGGHAAVAVEQPSLVVDDRWGAHAVAGDAPGELLDLELVVRVLDAWQRHLGQHDLQDLLGAGPTTVLLGELFDVNLQALVSVPLLDFGRS